MSKNNRFCLFTLHLSHVKNGVWLWKRGISTYDYFITEIIIKAYASVNSSCAQTPPPHPLSLDWIPGISIFFASDGKFPGVGTLELSNPLGWGRKKRANAPSSVNTATFFIDHTVEECHFKHFNVRFFVSINRKHWFTSTASEFRYVILAWWAMKKCMHKIENTALQTSSIFPRPWQTSQSACFSSKILCVVIF